ncbi:Uncharacterised protein [Helicobacter muridarum]|uniref:Uncharacterized protein n=1 Tax=Helicobacter muridarum TaxID=216 RepID=A0A377PRY5_9HELI|nr:Uncharacterised protein [Helicobacter muridarum]
MARIFNDENIKLPDDFGVLLTKYKLDLILPHRKYTDSKLSQ